LLVDAGAPGNPCVQLGDPHGELPSATASFPQRFRQPTSIDKYNGEMEHRVYLNDYRLACQSGGAITDEVIIRNMSLHLADSVRTWLEHLPAS
jgi:hypothetical protein